MFYGKRFHYGFPAMEKQLVFLVSDIKRTYWVEMSNEEFIEIMMRSFDKEDLMILNVRASYPITYS